jgi:hypothetical protein
MRDRAPRIARARDQPMSEPPAEAPGRLTLPTCIGCGAMSKFGTCETGCSEHKLELVRAAAHDALMSLQAQTETAIDGFRRVTERLRDESPVAGGHERAYRSVQRDARAALHHHPDRRSHDPGWGPAESATTWWCPQCGGIDAPQPCLGICVWRPVEWVNRNEYDRERDRALAARAHENELRDLVRLIATVTPRDGGWERTWSALRTQAGQAPTDQPAPPGANRTLLS